MKNILIIILGFSFISFFSFCQTKPAKKNWVVLFDGSNLDKWKGYNKNEIGSGWQIKNKELVLEKGGAGDIITKQQYENFELELEWKISEGGNSGIFFNVVEDTKYSAPYYSGPEIQILDNERHPDAKAGKNDNRHAGSLYDIIPSSVKAKPAGEWNKTRIVINNGKAQFFLNDKKSVEFNMWDEKWEKLVEDSKFKGWEAFAKSKKGHIGLQDHGDKVVFRNIRVREL